MSKAITIAEIRKQYRRNQKSLNRIVLLTQTNSLPDIHNIGGEWVINQMLTDLLIEQEYIRKRERENWGWRKEVFDFSNDAECIL